MFIVLIIIMTVVQVIKEGGAAQWGKGLGLGCHTFSSLSSLESTVVTSVFRWRNRLNSLLLAPCSSRIGPGSGPSRTQYYLLAAALCGLLLSSELIRVY